MFPRKYNKQNKFKRFLLKLLNVYAYERETLNIVNPNYKNSYGNIIKFNDKSFNFSQGYLDLSRKINKLDIFFRYAPNSNLYKSKGSWKRIIPNINKEQLISTCIISLKETIFTVPGTKLEIITSGAKRFDMSDIVTKDQINKFFDVLKQEYDYLIIDSPPVQPVSDTLILTQAVDHNFFIIRLYHINQT